MKSIKYEVVFISGQKEVVIALGGEQAKILAQAIQIQKGNNHEVLSVTNIE